MTIASLLGWWMLPAAITIVAFTLAYLAQPRDVDPYEGIVSFAEYYWVAAFFVSLFAWLLYGITVLLAG